MIRLRNQSTLFCSQLASVARDDVKYAMSGRFLICFQNFSCVFVLTALSSPKYAAKSRGARPTAEQLFQLHRGPNDTCILTGARSQLKTKRQPNSNRHRNSDGGRTQCRPR